jgi:exosome complex RNA-binding protein Rrp42 (RNase PH superfamily)
MMTFLIVTFFILLLVALMVAVSRRSEPVIYDDFDDEVTHTTVTTTTTSEQPAPLIATVGIINAYQKAGNPQWYVVDPVDKEETAVNTDDDYYRDAGGKVWDLQ